MGATVSDSVFSEKDYSSCLAVGAASLLFFSVIKEWEISRSFHVDKEWNLTVGSTRESRKDGSCPF